MEYIVIGLRRVWILALIVSLFSACSKPQPSVDKLGKIVETDFFKNNNPLISIRYDSCGNNYIVGADSGFVYFIQNRNGKFHLKRKINCLTHTSSNISRRGIVIYSLSVEYKQNGDTIIWAGLRNNGLQKFALNGKLEHQKTFIIEKKESNYSPYDILQVSEDAFLVASSNGLYLSNPSTDTLNLLYHPDYKLGIEPREFRVFNLLKTNNSGYFASSKEGLIHLNSEKSKPEIIIPTQVNYIFKKSKEDTIYALVPQNFANNKAFTCDNCVVLPVPADGNPLSLYVDDNSRRWVFYAKSIEIQGKHPYKSKLSKYTKHPFVLVGKHVLFFGDEQFWLGLKNDNYEGTGTELENIAVDPVDQSFYALDSNGGIYRSGRNSSKITKFAQLKNINEYIGMVAYNGRLFLISSNTIYQFSKFDEVFSYQMIPRAFFSPDGIINCFAQDGSNLLLGTRKGIEEINLVQGYSKKLIDSVYIDHIQCIGKNRILFNILNKSENQHNNLTEPGVSNRNDWRILTGTNELKDLNDTALKILNASPNAIYLNNRYYAFKNNSIEITSEKNRKTCIDGIADINPDQIIAQDGQKIYFIAKNGGAFMLDTITDQINWLSFSDNYAYFYKIAVIIGLLLGCIVMLALWTEKRLALKKDKANQLTSELKWLILRFKGSAFESEITLKLNQLQSGKGWWLKKELLDKLTDYVRDKSRLIDKVNDRKLMIKERVEQLAENLIISEQQKSEIEQKTKVLFDLSELKEIVESLDEAKQKKNTLSEVTKIGILRDKIVVQMANLQEIAYLESQELFVASKSVIEGYKLNDLAEVHEKNACFIESYKNLMKQRDEIFSEFNKCFKTSEIIRLTIDLKKIVSFRNIDGLREKVVEVENLIKQFGESKTSNDVLKRFAEVIKECQKLDNKEDQTTITKIIADYQVDISEIQLEALHKILEIEQLIGQSSVFSKITQIINERIVTEKGERIDFANQLIKNLTLNDRSLFEEHLGNLYTDEVSVLFTYLSSGYLVAHSINADVFVTSEQTIRNARKNLKPRFTELTSALGKINSPIIKNRITRLMESWLKDMSK